MRYVRFLVVTALLLSLVFNIVMYRKYRATRPILTVNGEGLTKKAMDDFLEQSGGINTKRMLVERMVIDQAAGKQGVTPSQKEVDEMFDQQRELNPQVAQAVAYNPWSLDEMKNKIRIEMEKQRLRAKTVPITDDEIKTEYQTRPEAYDEPDKVKIELAMILDAGKTDEIAELMRKKPPVEPLTIEQNYSQRVRFQGDKGIYTVARPFGKTAQDPNGVFAMKEGDVNILPPGDLAAQGVQKIIIRKNGLVPGRKVDPTDPKIKEKIRLALALQRAKPWSEMLSDIWKNTDFQSDDVSEKKYIEMLMFPDRARSGNK